MSPFPFHHGTGDFFSQRGLRTAKESSSLEALLIVQSYIHGSYFWPFFKSKYSFDAFQNAPGELGRNSVGSVRSPQGPPSLPATCEPGMGAIQTQRCRQEDQKLKDTLSYTGSLRPP